MIILWWSCDYRPPTSRLYRCMKPTLFCTHSNSCILQMINNNKYSCSYYSIYSLKSVYKWANINSGHRYCRFKGRVFSSMLRPISRFHNILWFLRFVEVRTLPLYSTLYPVVCPNWTVLSKQYLKCFHLSIQRRNGK